MLKELWLEFSNSFRETLHLLGPGYRYVHLISQGPRNFSWDLLFEYSAYSIDRSVVGSDGLSIVEYAVMAMAAGATVELATNVGRSAAERATALARENIRQEGLSIVAQEALGLSECRVAFAALPSTTLFATSPFSLRVMILNTNDRKYTEAQYEELIIGLKQYFRGVLGMEFSLAPFSAGIANKKTHKRGKNKGKISGGLIDLTFICGESVEPIG